MGLVYVCLLIAPLLFKVFILIILRRWTQVSVFVRSLVAVLSAPAPLIYLYSSSSSTADADQRSAFAVAVGAYVLGALVLVRLLEWRHGSKL